MHRPALRDPAETGVRGAGLFRGREAETGRAFFASGWRRWLVDGDIRRQLTRHGIDYLLLRTDRPILAPLRAFFKARGRRWVPDEPTSFKRRSPQTSPAASGGDRLCGGLRR